MGYAGETFHNRFDDFTKPFIHLVDGILPLEHGIIQCSTYAYGAYPLTWAFVTAVMTDGSFVRYTIDSIFH